MICPICGGNNPDNVPFCSLCGASLNSSPLFAQPVNVKNENGKGLAVASLVLGIIGLVLCPGGLCSLLSMIFGIVSKKKGYNASGLATSGLVLGVIGVTLTIIAAIVLIVGGSALTMYLYELFNELTTSTYGYY